VNPLQRTLLVIASLLIALLIIASVPYEEHGYICLHCRSNRVVGKCLGISHDRVEPAPALFGDSDRPVEHTHHWCHVRHSRGYLLMGGVDINASRPPGETINLPQ
jgi:hypothetical protein